MTNNRYADLNKLFKTIGDGSVLTEYNKKRIIELLKSGKTPEESADEIYTKGVAPLIRDLRYFEAEALSKENHAKIKEIIDSRIEILNNYTYSLYNYAAEVYEQIVAISEDDYLDMAEEPEEIVNFFDEKLAGDIYPQDKDALKRYIDEGLSADEAAKRVYEERYKNERSSLAGKKNRAKKKLGKLQENDDATEEAVSDAFDTYADLESAHSRISMYQNYLKLYAKDYARQIAPKGKPAKAETESTALVVISKNKADKIARDSFLAGLTDERKADLAALAEERGETPEEVVEFYQATATLETLAATLDVVAERRKAAPAAPAAAPEPVEEDVAPLADKPTYKFTARELKFLEMAGYNTPEKLDAYVSKVGYGVVKSTLYMVLKVEKERETESEKGE